MKPASCGTRVAQLAGELDTTIDVVRRLLDQAGIQRSSWKVRSARQRRTTDRRLTERAARLGFVSLHAYLADRVTQQAWPLTQLASELGWTAATKRACRLAGPYRHVCQPPGRSRAPTVRTVSIRCRAAWDPSPQQEPASTGSNARSPSTTTAGLWV